MWVEFYLVAVAVGSGQCATLYVWSRAHVCVRGRVCMRRCVVLTFGFWGGEMVVQTRESSGKALMMMDYLVAQSMENGTPEKGCYGP
jgi:hypothetical protein